MYYLSIIVLCILLYLFIIDYTDSMIYIGLLYIIYLSIFIDIIIFIFIYLLLYYVYYYIYLL